METHLIIGGWIAVFFTLSIYSMLYKDNFFFKLAENIYVGVSLGYFASLGLYQNLKKLVYNVFFDEKYSVDASSADKVVALLALAGGLLLFTRFIKKYQWISRITMAFLLGYTAGVAIPSAVESFLLRQVSSTVVSISFDWSALQQVFIIVGVLSVLLYFYFSSEHTGPLKYSSRVALIFIVTLLGSLYGTTVMGRLSLLYGRFSDLITYSGDTYFYATFVIGGIFVLYFALTRKAGGGDT